MKRHNPLPKRDTLYSGRIGPSTRVHITTEGPMTVHEVDRIIEIIEMFRVTFPETNDEQMDDTERMLRAQSEWAP